MKLRHVWAFWVVLMGIVLHGGAAWAQDSVRLVLQWLPQAQFAGYYMAQEKGFYAEAGLDVTLLPGGPDVIASNWLQDGRADYATMFLSAGLQHRVTMPIVNVGQFVQHSALMLMVKASSDIERVEHLQGRKVGLWENEFHVQPQSLFRERRMDVIEVPQTSSLDLFMRGGVDAASGMWYNEYHTLYTYGLDYKDIRAFFFKDLGYDFPEDGLYCLEDTHNRNPERSRALTAATRQGWLYAFDHPDETIDVIIQRMAEAGVPNNRAHQTWMLARMRDIIDVTDPKTVGVLKKADYDRVRDILLHNGFLGQADDYAAFYKGVQP